MRHLLVVPLLVVLIGAAQVHPAHGDLDEIKARGTLRVLVSADEDPVWFSLAANGEPGFDRELLEGFARLHGLALEVVQVPQFEDIIPALLEGRGDVINGINDTEERRKHIAFTREVLPSQHVVITLRPHAVVTTPAQLRDERVGVVTGTTWEEAAAEHVPQSALVGFADAPALMQALRRGEITATVMTLSDVLPAQRKDPDIQAGTLLGAPISTCWGLRREDSVLRATIDEFLFGTRRSGAWNRLLVKYFEEGALQVLGKASQR
jgi:ABC-type amino acid transport substrate-binding protein